MSGFVCIDHNELRGFVGAVYCQLGVPQGDADLLADTLVQADLWGHQSHGVLRTPWYAERIRNGVTAAQTRTEHIVEAGAIAVIDGRDGIGQVITQHATNEAVSRARLHGVGAVSVRNSGHFGTAMYFTRQIAEAGCVALLTTNASPAMAPWGGTQKVVGNNPWSIAAPMGGGQTMVLDIANTAVARGKIYLARQEGRSIPDGWAMTDEGVTTNDPAAAIAGLIMPIAGHKGYGISVMMDVLAGVLSGSAFGADVHGPYEPNIRSGVGHFVLALDIEKFRPLDAFQRDLQEMAQRLKAVPKAKGAEAIYFPGEIESLADQRHRAAGLTLPALTVHELNQLAEAVGLTERLWER